MSKTGRRNKASKRKMNNYYVSHDCDIDPDIDPPGSKLLNMTALKKIYGGDVPAGIRTRNGRVTR